VVNQVILTHPAASLAEKKQSERYMEWTISMIALASLFLGSLDRQSAGLGEELVLAKI
jgi:hypothetical protein